MTTNPYRIKMTMDEVRGIAHYIVRTSEGRIYAASHTGIPEALSNFAPDGMALRFALEDADSATEAVVAIRTHAWKRYGAVAQVIA